MTIQFSLGNGIAIKIDGQNILLDPKVSDFISFVSHAHFDHSPYEIIKKPYCTEETFELIKLREPNFEANVVKENKKIKFDNFSAKLISSGHILGSTQTFIETDSCSILYTGDFKLSQGLTSEPIKIQQADILIIEATYGLPDFQFPSIEETRQKLIKWISEQIGKGYRVNLGGYQIGKAQEIIKILNSNGYIPQISETIRKYCEIYNKFDAKLEFLKKEEISEINVKPMHVVPLIKSRKVKGCVLTGWALFRNYGTFGLPLSDHSDFNQLIQFIQEVKPKKVYCVHGYTKQLAKEINSRLKISAQPLLIQGQKLLTEFQ